MPETNVLRTPVAAHYLGRLSVALMSGFARETEISVRSEAVNVPSETRTAALSHPEVETGWFARWPAGEMSALEPGIDIFMRAPGVHEKRITGRVEVESVAPTDWEF